MKRAGFQPVPAVDVTVLADGGLELAFPGRGDRYRCGPVGAAMWIALCQNKWEAGAAAHALAEVWDVDPENMRAELDIWVGELFDAGLVLET